MPGKKSCFSTNILVDFRDDATIMAVGWQNQMKVGRIQKTIETLICTLINGM